MRVVVAGGTGWIGSALCRSFVADGHTVIVLSRRGGASRAGSSSVRHVMWDGRFLGEWAHEVDGADAVVNLAGESIANGRWTDARKRDMWASRTDPTAALVAAIEQAERRPPVLVNASAVGYYGDRGDDVLTESDPPGKDFLARLVVDWERTALEAVELGVRVCALRQGLVFGPGGGALQPLAIPFRLFVGGHVGSGEQWAPWIHIDDTVGLFRFAIEHPEASGPINAVAPEPVTNAQLASTLGKVLGRPSWVPVPTFALRAVLGELADQILVSQRATPAAANRLGYDFAYPTLTRALRGALSAAA